MSDIFDLDDLRDLPDSLSKQLSVNYVSDFSAELIALFELAKRPLSIDEVAVSYFRKYGKQKDRKKFMTRLYNMSRRYRPLVRTVKGRKGVYVLNEVKK